MSFIDSEDLVEPDRLPVRRMSRRKLVRNARARKKIERRLDREVLRRHVEEVWD